jgi:hypothetical protein
VLALGSFGPRRCLDAEMRRLRAGLGLHLDHVATQLHCSASKISSSEAGKGLPEPRGIQAPMEIYGVAADAEREMLMRLVRESRAKGWWEPYTVVQPESFFMDEPERYVGLETDAVELQSFESELLHDLLQTPDYCCPPLTMTTTASFRVTTGYGHLWRCSSSWWRGGRRGAGSWSSSWRA